MEVNELRIGNFIDNYAQQCIVMGIYNGNKVELGYFTDSIGFIWSLDDIGIKPITLTEEWLLKFGFTDNETCYNLSREKELGHKFGDFAVSIYDSTQLKFWRGRRYCGIVHCEFVHELQNLYFALTGQELELKENT